MLRASASRLIGLAHGASARQSTRTIVTAKLPDLAYDGALGPVIGGEIMQLHHAKHHNTYVTNFNVAMEKYAEAEQKGDVADDDLSAGCDQVQRRRARQPLAVLEESGPPGECAPLRESCSP